MTTDFDNLLTPDCPVLFWGPPGVGKTAAIEAYAHSRGIHIETIIASIREPSDFLGLPISSLSALAQLVSQHYRGEDLEVLAHKLEQLLERHRVVHMSIPDWAFRLIQAGGGILFFDELSTAPPANQAALLRIIHERMVGSVPLPRNTIFVAAANPPELAAGGWDLSPPLANRFTHVEWKLDPQEWVAHFPHYWDRLSNPKQHEDPYFPGLDLQSWERARRLVASFIRHRPNLLFQMPDSETLRSRAWPSPRTWDFASRKIARLFQQNTNPSPDPVSYTHLTLPTIYSV